MTRRGSKNETKAKPSVEVRLIESLEECRQCERIQRLTWGATGVTSEAMTAAAKYGGVLIGALAGGKVVGFIFAFLAEYHGRLAHWSHMMAVEPRYRDQGLGFKMKLVHRRVALKRGIQSICWTFDPLQSRNAYLNITRLGALPDEYVPDCYGRFPSLLERGLPSDRWVANWRISTRRVEDRLRGKGPPFNPRLPRVNFTQRNKRGFLENAAMRLDLTDRQILVEIPDQTQAMRAKALPLARRWRMETREIFQTYLSRRYHVQDFFPPYATKDGTCFYLLRRFRET
jgi:predicted GNAT superfamily acetyltransferase